MTNQLLIGNQEARAWIVHNLLEKDGLFKLSKDEIDTVCSWTEGIYLVHAFWIQNSHTSSVMF